MTNGLAKLTDVNNPSIRQKINAEYSLTFEYPLMLDDDKAQYIEKENIIKVENQLFRIREIEKIDTGYTQWLKVYADHVFFDLIDYYTEDKRAVETSVQVALEILLQGTPFKVGLCDDLGSGTAYFIEENKLQSINDKIIPRWNCEIEIDNYTVTAKKRIGKDRNYHIRRGKNLKGINYREDMSNVVTRLYAKGYDGLTFDDINDGKKYVDSPLIGKYAHVKAGDHHFEDIEDKEELLEAAQEHILTLDKPYIHYDIDLVELRDSDDYKHYRDLEVFGLGDTVQIYNDKLGIDIGARILEYEYNPKRKQNSVVVLGNFTQRLEDTLGQFEDTKRKVDNSITDDGYVRTSRLQGKIDALVNQLVFSGAYKHASVIDDAGLLFENTDRNSNSFGAMYIGPGIFALANEKNADNTWKWRTFGTGNGITADEINTGILNAELIKSGRLMSYNGKTWIDMDNGMVNIGDVLKFDGSTLELVGDFATYQELKKAIEMVGNSILLYDWEGTSRDYPVARIFTGRRNQEPDKPSLSLAHELDAHIAVLYRTDTGNYISYMDFDTYNRTGTSMGYPVAINQEALFKKDALLLGKMYFRDGAVPWISKRPGNDGLDFVISGADNGGYSFRLAGGSAKHSYLPGRDYPFIFYDHTRIDGDFTVTGSKNALHKTENYGSRLLNAYETAEYYSGDIGSGRTDRHGECKVSIEEIFKETINTDIEYHVFLQKHGEGDIWVEERHRDYFIVKGTPNLSFSWELKAKRIGYENVRLKEVKD